MEFLISLPGKSFCDLKPGDKEVVLNGVVQLYKVFNFGNTWHILGGFWRFCSTISHVGCERIVVCHIL